MRQRGLLKALGVRIRRVADLDEGAIYLSRSKILLLDLEMDDRQIVEAIDEVFLSLWE